MSCVIKKGPEHGPFGEDPQIEAAEAAVAAAGITPGPAKRRTRASKPQENPETSDDD
jgi:hypothetical protein